MTMKEKIEETRRAGNIAEAQFLTTVWDATIDFLKKVLELEVRDEVSYNREGDKVVYTRVVALLDGEEITSIGVS